jgi:class 3 adenylate cyclase
MGWPCNCVGNATYMTLDLLRIGTIALTDTEISGKSTEWKSAKADWRQLEGNVMKLLTNNPISLFEKWIAARQSYVPINPGDAIVSGYKCTSSIDRQEALPKSCDRHLAGIFYADVAEYARLTEQDEEGTHRHLIEAMKIMKAHIDADNGHVAHFAGEAILAEFKDVDSALHCAINVQLAARQWNATVDLESQVRFRIGVNFSEVIADHDDIHGNAVNLAARLESLASSGGICISDTVRTELANKSAFKFVALGKQYVKKVCQPVEAFWIDFEPLQIIDTEQTGVMKISAVTS